MTRERVVNNEIQVSSQQSATESAVSSERKHHSACWVSLCQDFGGGGAPLDTYSQHIDGFSGFDDYTNPDYLTDARASESIKYASSQP